MASYKTEVRVIYADTDAMGVVYHTNYIKWFEIGRTEMLRVMGYPYSQMESQGILLPVIEANCRYILPAHYDEILEVNARISEMKGATITIEYEIFRKENRDLLVTGMTKHALTDPDFKPIRLRNVNKGLYDRILEG